MTLRLKLNVGRVYTLHDNWSGWQDSCKYLGNQDGRHLFVFGKEDKTGYAVIEDAIIQNNIGGENVTTGPISAYNMIILNKAEIRRLGPQTKSIITNLFSQLGEQI